MRHKKRERGADFLLVPSGHGQFVHDRYLSLRQSGTAEAQAPGPVSIPTATQDEDKYCTHVILIGKSRLTTQQKLNVDPFEQRKTAKNPRPFERASKHAPSQSASCSAEKRNWSNESVLRGTGVRLS